MTAEEAIEYLKITRLAAESGSVGEIQKDMCNTAIEALEKQIPKKPILKSGETLMHINKGDKPHEWKTEKYQDWVCPVCGWFVGERVKILQTRSHDQRKSDYCVKCGQHIDWSEEE